MEKSESVKGDAEKPAPKTKKKTAKKASRKKAQRAKEGADTQPEAKAEEASKAPATEASAERKEPIQGVRDTRTKKEESEARPEARQSNDEQRDSRDQDGDGSQQGAKRNRRGRRGRKSAEQPVQQPKPVVKVDHKKMSKKAWKIFLGEVNEEGLALIGIRRPKSLPREVSDWLSCFLRRNPDVCQVPSLSVTMILAGRMSPEGKGHPRRKPSL